MVKLESIMRIIKVKYYYAKKPKGKNPFGLTQRKISPFSMR
jgi:hypothetical protein